MPILKIPARYGEARYGYSYYGIIDVYPIIYKPATSPFLDEGGLFTDKGIPYGVRGGRVE